MLTHNNLCGFLSPVLGEADPPNSKCSWTHEKRLDWIVISARFFGRQCLAKKQEQKNVLMAEGNSEFMYVAPSVCVVFYRVFSRRLVLAPKSLWSKSWHRKSREAVKRRKKMQSVWFLWDCLGLFQRVKRPLGNSKLAGHLNCFGPMRKGCFYSLRPIWWLSIQLSVFLMHLPHESQVKGDPSKKELKKESDEKSGSSRNPGEKKTTSSDKASK